MKGFPTESLYQFPLPVLAILACFLLFPGTSHGMEGHESMAAAQTHVRYLPQETLRRVLASKSPWELTRKRFTFFVGDSHYTATTTIDQSLQAYLDGLFEDAIGARSAIVCIDPISGRVVAMSGFDRGNPLSKVWTERLVPSASIFKIVTAAGAMEFYSMTPFTVLYFNGRRHTLYRSQLQDRRNRYSSRVTLKEAFASSINPVFGKLGMKYLKREGLMEMATRFLWRTVIPFELPVMVSPIEIGDDPFSLAEVASGFNRDTRTTALHEALISAGIANGGVIMAPSFVDMVVEKGGEIVYQNKFYPLVRALNPKTASLLRQMMQETITKGTAKRAFRGWKKDGVLKELVIGGKTGTIDSGDHLLRYDLFSGFACSRRSGRCLSVGVFVAHQGVLGRRSASYARLAFRKYFENLQH